MRFEASDRVSRKERRGAAYLMVLGTTLVVATLSLSGLLMARARLAAAGPLRDALGAQENARAGVELAAAWIANDPNWRINRSLGMWAKDLPLTQGTVSIEASEPIDGNLVNRPYDAVRLLCTGQSETARQLWEVTLQADPEPLPALQYALHCSGQLRVKSGHTLTVRKAAADTDRDLRNDGTIVGNIEAASVSSTGAIVGSLKLDSTTEAHPADPFSMYVAIGTEITPGPVIERQVLSPGVNPWGQTNPDGVYIIRSNSDLTIRNCRIHGTLVVRCSSGTKVYIDGLVLMHPYRTDYPTLLIDGEAELRYHSSVALMESTVANLNPSSSPYKGASDSDLLDTYPSEIRGLVQVRGKLKLANSALVRGIVLADSSTGSNDVEVEGSNEIVYDESLYKMPPQGYASRVWMLPQAGTWKRVVE
jgi:hypothetical protein